MAINPRDAAKINDEAERKAVELMEESIDTKLCKEFRTGKGVEFYAQTLRKTPGWTNRAQDEVFKRFRSVGWQITTRSLPDRQGSETVYDFTEAPHLTASNDSRQHLHPVPWSGV